MYFAGVYDAQLFPQNAEIIINKIIVVIS